MLTGKDLGDAIAAAIKKKGVTKKAFADAMGVQPASVQDWIKYGRVAKIRINDLLAYFSDVADAQYWGLNFTLTTVTQSVFDPVPSSSREVMHSGSMPLHAQVNPGSADVKAGLKIQRDELERFVNELRDAFEGGKLTPKRLSLLRDLLEDAIESQPTSYEQQKLTTRGVHGGARGHTTRKKTG